MPSRPGTRVGALSAVIVGANEPTFCFSVGVRDAGDCGALVPVGDLVSVGDSVVPLPQAVTRPMPMIADVPARSANLVLTRVAFTDFSSN